MCSSYHPGSEENLVSALQDALEKLRATSIDDNLLVVVKVKI